MTNYNPRDYKFPRTYREATGVEYGKGSTPEKYPWKAVISLWGLIIFSLLFSY